MGIATNHSQVQHGEPSVNQAGELFPPNLNRTEVPLREVVRCQQCQLVQFRTQTDLCRRCSKPLPSLLRFLQESAALDTAHRADEPVGAAMEMPLDRAGRNRQVSIGAKMQELREARQMTQIEMSALLAIPRSYLSRIENSRLLPGPLMIAKFAAALGIPVSELLPPERRKDGRRLFPNDPEAAAVYTQFARLEPAQMEIILAAARRMLIGRVIPLPVAGAQRALPLAPSEPAKMEPPLKKAPASFRPETNRPAIAAATGRSATR